MIVIPWWSYYAIGNFPPGEALHSYSIQVLTSIYGCILAGWAVRILRSRCFFCQNTKWSGQPSRVNETLWWISIWWSGTTHKPCTDADGQTTMYAVECSVFQKSCAPSTAIPIACTHSNIASPREKCRMCAAVLMEKATSHEWFHSTQISKYLSRYLCWHSEPWWTLLHVLIHLHMRVFFRCVV